MCGIFGGVAKTTLSESVITKLAYHAAQRGHDSAGYACWADPEYLLITSDFAIEETLRRIRPNYSSFIAGHSRLITHGENDNQPILRDGLMVLHNGIVLNADELWHKLGKRPNSQIDSEIIPALAADFLAKGVEIEQIPALVLERCEGVINAVLVFPIEGKILLFSNNGSLYSGEFDQSIYFASEKFPLVSAGCENISQITGSTILDVPSSALLKTQSLTKSRLNLIPKLSQVKEFEEMLSYETIELNRCKECVLPSSMPFISFNEDGVCNYCLNYTPRNQPKPMSELYEILEKYRRISGPDLIFPFSGGRDSSFGLHFAVKELGLKPIAYTYDWGMVTDLGRRNISRMCAELSVENIVVAADIEWKRKNIRKNLEAWLKSPNLGMLSILTAGDKHFFRHIETIKEQTQISFNLWSVNPLEVTHFKAGFLGVPPNFEEKMVYQSGVAKQLRYQSLRLREMFRSPGYFNSSLIDTLSGEYFRSRKNKSDYYHLFDYLKWDEHSIDNCLDGYGWERATDTSTTWRIGDGTAAFYNYVYHRVAGFSEHDTFRSNRSERVISRVTKLLSIFSKRICLATKI